MAWAATWQTLLGLLAVTGLRMNNAYFRPGGVYRDLPDLDTAIAAAKLLPRQYTVEIRPTVKIDGYQSG